MEYHYHVPPRFSRQRVSHESSDDYYFHHYDLPVYDYIGAAIGVNDDDLFISIPPGVDSVWLAPMIPRRNFSHRLIRTYQDDMDNTLIFDDASTITQIRRHRRARFALPPRLRGGLRNSRDEVNNTLIFDDASTIRQTPRRPRRRRRGHYELPPRLQRRIRSREQYPQYSPLDEANDMQGSSVADNGLSTERRVSEFLEARTSSEIINEEICVVCQDDLGTDWVATLDCRHRYHFECIKSWLTLKNICPICKAKVLDIVDL